MSDDSDTTDERVAREALTHDSPFYPIAPERMLRAYYPAVSQRCGGPARRDTLDNSRQGPLWVNMPTSRLHRYPGVNYLRSVIAPQGAGAPGFQDLPS